MKKIILLLAIMLAPFFASAQTSEYYIYNIVTFDGTMKREGLKVNIDDDKTIDKLKDENGKAITFKTVAAAYMYLTSKGWQIFWNEGTTLGNFGLSDTLNYIIIRKPCTKEEFEKAVADGIISNPKKR